MNQTLLILRALDALFSIVVNTGVNMQRYNEMKAANWGKPLSEEQLAELANSVQSNVDKL